MTTPKKHHYLPQFYLDRFKIIPQNGRYPHIYRIEKSGSPKATSPAIKDTGCKTDYHTIDFTNQDKDRQTVENGLCKIETHQAHLISSICENSKITEDQKSALAELITTMRFRVPAFKYAVESYLEGTVLSIAKIAMQQGWLSKAPKEVQELIQQQGHDFLKADISNWKILQYMFQMASGSENSSLLERMKFQLVVAANGHSFVTGDSPVALYHPNYDSAKPYGVGPAFKDIEVTFPISKRLLVKLTWDGTENVTTIQKNEVKEYNRRTIIMAENQVFASEVKPGLMEELALYHNVKAGYKLDNLCYGQGSMHLLRFIPVATK